MTAATRRSRWARGDGGTRPDRVPADSRAPTLETVEAPFRPRSCKLATVAG